MSGGTTNPTTKAEDLPALTRLRFVAAALIVLHHMRGAFGLPEELLQNFPLDNGVSFFFILSGFILSHAYRTVHSEPERNRFYLARFARVWPTHIACLVLWLLIIRDPSRIGTSTSWTSYVLNVFLLQAWSPDYRVFFSLNAVSWTISVEAFFYLLFPFIAVCSGRKLMIWLAFSFGLVIAMALFDSAFGESLMSFIDAPRTVNGLMYINPLPRLFEFVLGIVAARIWMKQSHWFCYGELGATLVQFLALALLVFTALNFGRIYGFANSTFGPPFAIWVGKAGANCLPFAILIISMASRNGLLRHVFSTGLMVFLGKISFAIYLFHQIPIFYYQIHRQKFADVNDAAMMCVYLAIVLGMATVLHLYVEEPLRKGIMSSRRRKQLA